MKIALVQPVAPKEIKLNIVPALGLGYIAASLLKCGHEVHLIDCIKLRHDVESFRKRIAELSPDVLGFSLYSCDLPQVYEDVSWAAKHLTDTVIIAGGPHPSAVPGLFFEQLPSAHFGIAGEGEYSLPRLLELLNGNRSPVDIPGLIYTDNGKTIANSPQLISDLSELPFPAWELIDPLSYPASPQGIFFKHLPIAPIITTRGCPFPCTFCSGRAVHGTKIRKRPIPDVIAEITYLKNKFGINEIHVLDDNFTHDRAFASDFCRMLIEQRIEISWCCPNGIRLDTLDGPLTDLMKKSGCYSISVGIESGSQEILDSMKKGLKKSVIAEKISLIKKSGLTANGFFIIGFPGETEKTAAETIRFSLELPLDRASFFNFLPLPGTPATCMLAESGELKSIDFSKLYYTYTPYVPVGMTGQRLKSLQRKAFLSFFFRPRIILGILKSLRTPAQMVFLLKRVVSYLK